MSPMDTRMTRRSGFMQRPRGRGVNGIAWGRVTVKRLVRMPLESAMRRTTMRRVPMVTEVWCEWLCQIGGGGLLLLVMRREGYYITVYELNDHEQRIYQTFL